MYKYIILLLGLLTLSSCVTTDYASLDQRITKLEKAKATSTMLLAEQAGARKFWWRNALTEGTDALDAISHLLLSDGDSAFVMTKDGTTMNSWLYVYNSSGADAEDGTNYTVIAPDSGGGRWYLVNFNGAQVTSRAAAGTHYIEVTNAGDLAAGSKAEGRCWYDTTNHLFKCIGSDGSTVQTIGP
jgi:hypothetical protein